MLCANCQQPRKLSTGNLCSSCYSLLRYGPNWRDRYKRTGECKKCGRVKRLVNTKGLCLKCRVISQHGKAAWHKQRLTQQRRRTGRGKPQKQPCDICKAFVRVQQDHSHDLPCGHGAGARPCEKCKRGFLCGKCNRALGLFQDSPYTLEAALNYLLTWRSQQGR